MLPEIIHIGHKKEGPSCIFLIRADAIFASRTLCGSMIEEAPAEVLIRPAALRCGQSRWRARSEANQSQKPIAALTLRDARPKVAFLFPAIR
jgi:hypothetical protein